MNLRKLLMPTKKEETKKVEWQLNSHHGDEITMIRATNSIVLKEMQRLLSRKGAINGNS